MKWQNDPELTQRLTQLRAEIKDYLLHAKQVQKGADLTTADRFRFQRLTNFFNGIMRHVETRGYHHSFIAEKGAWEYFMRAALTTGSRDNYVMNKGKPLFNPYNDETLGHLNHVFQNEKQWEEALTASKLIPQPAAPSSKKAVLGEWIGVLKRSIAS